MIVVVGQGYVGLPLALSIAKKFDFCFGLDKSIQLVTNLNMGLTNSSEFNLKDLKKVLKLNKYKATERYSVVRQSDVVLFCLPTPISAGKPDLRILKNSLRVVSRLVKPKTLIILESSVNPGLTRNLRNLFPNNDIAFSPERIDPLNKKWDVKNTPKLVAGLTDRARDRAVEFYSKFIDTVIPCSSLEVAETAKLLENSFRLINISFINELSIFCQKMGIEVNEVIKAASTKPYGFMPFYPSVGFIYPTKRKKSMHQQISLM